MTKRWSGTVSDLTKTKRQASKEMRSADRAMITDFLKHEADLCISDIVPGDEIGRREANARAGALITAAEDIRQGRHAPHEGESE